MTKRTSRMNDHVTSIPVEGPACPDCDTVHEDRRTLCPVRGGIFR